MPHGDPEESTLYDETLIRSMETGRVDCESWSQR